MSHLSPNTNCITALKTQRKFNNPSSIPTTNISNSPSYPLLFKKKRHQRLYLQNSDHASYYDYERTHFTHSKRHSHERTRPAPSKRRDSRFQRYNGWKHASFTLHSHLHLRTNALCDAGPSLHQKEQAGGSGDGSAATRRGCRNAASGILEGTGAEGTGDFEGGLVLLLNGGCLIGRQRTWGWVGSVFWATIDFA